MDTEFKGAPELKLVAELKPPAALKLLPVAPKLLLAALKLPAALNELEAGATEREAAGAANEVVAAAGVNEAGLLVGAGAGSEEVRKGSKQVS